MFLVAAEAASGRTRRVVPSRTCAKDAFGHPDPSSRRNRPAQSHMSRIRDEHEDAKAREDGQSGDDLAVSPGRSRFISRERRQLHRSRASGLDRNRNKGTCRGCLRTICPGSAHERTRYPGQVTLFRYPKWESRQTRDQSCATGSAPNGANHGVAGDGRNCPTPVAPSNRDV